MKSMDFLINACQRQKVIGMTDDRVVAFLREQGCSKVESIAIISRAFVIGLNEAKELIHSSEGWADVLERDTQFHQTLENTLS
ncbi:MAG: hypothetical protein LBK60_06965 [Verrucomicrobiales bacterium]|jgi:ribosomal protein L7/L12|nr:hypothetical protein [Verrucomicrobiales bacterium]